MSDESFQCNIRFNSTEIELGKKKAASLGMSFSKWIKYLVSKEIEPLSEFSTTKEQKPRQMTTQEMIDADKKMIEELVEEARNSPIDPETDLPY